MISKEDLVETILNFTDEEFYRADGVDLASRENRLLDTDFSGIAINGPSRIPTDTRDTLPLIMASRYDGDRDWEVSLAENCIVVGTSLHDGRVYFAPALASAKELESRGRRVQTAKGPKPSAEELEGEGAQLTVLEVRERLPLTWQTGTWRLGIIYYDWTSNIVTVDLQGPEEIQEGPTPIVFPPLKKNASKGLPHYWPSPNIPNVPSKGLTFTVDSRVEQERQRLKIFGAFTLPVRRFHIPEQAQVHHLPNGQEESVAAVIPITLAIVGLDWLRPLQFDWGIPVYGTALKEGMVAQGHFALDAFAGDQKPTLDPGKYQAYLLMDGYIFGPHSFEIQGVH